MTENEFVEKQNELLEQVPQAFRGFVSYHSWEKGHACGYDEVLLIAESLISELAPAIAQFKKDMFRNN
jgi:hypothetical protein